MRITELFANIAFCLMPYALTRVITLCLKKRYFNIRREIALLLYYCALITILSVTGLTSLSGFNTDIRLDVVNLTPFATISRMNTNSGHGFLNIVGNVVLFVPFGFFVLLLWRQNGIYRTVLLGALLSFFIECAQLFLMRNPDIDDLMLNTAGAAIGCLICVVFKKVFPKTSARVTTGKAGFFAPLGYALFGVVCLFVRG